jgi:hypothetical protein
MLDCIGPVGRSLREMGLWVQGTRLSFATWSVDPNSCHILSHDAMQTNGTENSDQIGWLQ